MNLKKIELHGFKSFADKTEIPFESNVTGIVGPNGCGKSNVIDAVRWVLGEQAPKTLRVTKMPDLIFNGTTNRLSLSYCEVSLYLDNEDRRYNVDFDEVVITRKLVRGGEGEYFINRQPCRLKDIIDLFRDTGIGKEGYSIIGQGKIDEILSSSPDGRRKIFEEAAGISRHKARKIETERKLERARQDMSRINDILTEVGSTLGPLEKEASDACKVKSLREKLKYLEVSLFLHQCENSSENRERLRAKLKKANEELETQTKELERLNNDYNVTMMGIENGSKYSNMIRDEITNLRVAAEKAAGDSRALAKDIEYIKKDNLEIEEGRKVNKIKLEEKAKLIEEKFNLTVEKGNELKIKEQECDEITQEYNKISYAVEQQEKAIEASNE
ncbi:MAG: AAA family ATPase, partial [Clostridia bacterium]|nr:AAA family ATPase [Clostridia bacterium]